MRENLKLWGATGEVIDITPRLINDNGTRGQEIKQWLIEHPAVNCFVILDDDTDMGELHDHLVRCNTDYGLTDYTVNLAIRQLLS